LLFLARRGQSHPRARVSPDPKQTIPKPRCSSSGAVDGIVYLYDAPSVCSIGKAVGERQNAIASEPLPQRLTELLCRLSEREKAEQANQKKVGPLRAPRC
jgi:hypothetical protein